MKYLDQEGLRKVLQSLHSKINSKLAGKVSSITSSDLNNIVIDASIATNPSINLSQSLLEKINNINQSSGEFGFSDFKILTSPTSLTNADCGSLINIQGSTTITTKLPSSNTTSLGSRIEFLNNSTRDTIIATQGNDTLIFGNNNNNSISILPGDSAVFVSGIDNKWVLIGGTAQLSYSGSFASTGGTMSYQRIAGGLFIQKGQITCPRANIWYNFSFPMMFSNAGGVVVAVTPILESGMILDVRVCHDTPTNTGVQVACNKANITLDVIAIGN